MTKDTWFLRVMFGGFMVTSTLHAVRPMASYRALDIGATPAELGLVAGSFALLSLLIAVPIGRWIDRWGEARFVIVGGVLMGLVSLWIVTIQSVWALVASQAAFGFGQIMTIVALQTLVGSGAPEKRDGRYGHFAVAIALGQVVGPAVAGVLVTTFDRGTDPVFVATTGAGILVSVLGLTFARWPSRERAPRKVGRAEQPMLRTAWGVLRLPSMPYAMLASLSAVSTADIFAAYLPAYGEARGIPITTVTLLLSTRAMASMASRIVMGRLVARFGRKTLLLWCLALPGLLVAALPTLDLIPALFVLVAAAGFGLGMCQPLSLAWVASTAPDELRGISLGLRMTGNRFGQLAIPASAGVIAGAAGIGATFVATGVLLTMSAALVARSDFGAVPEPERPG